MNNGKITHGGGQNECKIQRNILEAHSKAIFWNLIKSFRRYYLGIWLIKLPFYTIFNEIKAQKWREKRAILYKNLQMAKKQYRSFRTLTPQMTAWVESSEFKEKYINTNHPYPPLLNPDSIDYESISAELAWDINLPLPPKYKMFYLFAHTELGFINLEPQC